MGSCCCCTYAYNPAYTQSPNTTADGGGGSPAPVDTSQGQGASGQANTGAVVSTSDGALPADAQTGAGQVEENLDDVSVAPEPVDTSNGTGASGGGEQSPTPGSPPPSVGNGEGADGSQDGGVYAEPEAAGGGPAPSDGATGQRMVTPVRIDWTGLDAPEAEFDTSTGEVEYEGLPPRFAARMREAGAPEELIAYAAALELDQADLDELMAIVDGAKMRGEEIVVERTSGTGPGEEPSGDPVTRDPHGPDAERFENPSGDPAESETGAGASDVFTPEWKSRFEELLGDDPLAADYLAAVQREATSEAELVSAYEVAYRNLGKASQWDAEWEAKFAGVLGDSAQARAQIEEIRNSAFSEVALEFALERVTEMTSGPSGPVWSDEWEARFRELQEVDPTTGELVPLSDETIQLLREQNAGDADLEDAYNQIKAAAEQWLQLPAAERERIAKQMRLQHELQSGDAGFLTYLKMTLPYMPVVAGGLIGAGAAATGIGKLLEATGRMARGKQFDVALGKSGVTSMAKELLGRNVRNIAPETLRAFSTASTDQLRWLASKVGVDATGKRQALLERLTASKKVTSKLIEEMPKGRHIGRSIAAEAAARASGQKVLAGGVLVDFKRFEAAKAAEKAIKIRKDPVGRAKAFWASSKLRPAVQAYDAATKGSRFRAAVAAETKFATQGLGKAVGKSALMGAAFSALNLYMQKDAIAEKFRTGDGKGGSELIGKTVGESIGMMAGWTVGAKAGAAIGAAAFAWTGPGAGVAAAVGALAGGFIASEWGGKAVGWVGEKVGGFVHGLFGGDDARDGAKEIDKGNPKALTG